MNKTRKTPCNVPRVRELLGAPSEASIYQRVARREIPFRKFGRKLIFFEEEIAEFLERQPGVSVDEVLAGQE